MKKYHHDDDIFVAILCIILIFIGLCYCGALKDHYERNHIHDKINEETNVGEKEELHE